MLWKGLKIIDLFVKKFFLTLMLFIFLLYAQNIFNKIGFIAFV